MSNQVGDNLKSSIKRGGLSNLQVVITRVATPETETLFPIRGCEWKQTTYYDEGVDGKLDVHYYEFEIAGEFLQTDSATLSDLCSSAIDTQMHVTGVSTILTFLNGETKTFTLRWLYDPFGAGYGNVMGVKMVGKGSSLTPFFR